MEFNQLLQADINDIESLCLTSKGYYNVCRDRYFWQTKFQQDNIPYIATDSPVTVKEMIQKYHVGYAADLITDEVMFIYDIESTRGYDPHATMMINISQIPADLLQSLINIDGGETLIFLNDRYQYTMAVDEGDFHPISRQRMISILSHLLAYDLDTEILDYNSDYFLVNSNAPHLSANSRRRLGIRDAYENLNL